MGAIASITTPALVVAPGDSVTTELRIANGGDVVDEFTVEPLGDAAEWISAEPSSVNLFPGADATVTVRFAPPKAPSTVPGSTPFALKVVSREDPAGSIVEEGAIDVGAFDERAIELHPTTVTGRFGARYELAVDNRGNLPIEVALAGSDPQAACEFRFAHDVLTVQPGAAVFTKLRVKPLAKIWKGAPATHQFQVLASNAIGGLVGVAVPEQGESEDHASQLDADDQPPAEDLHVPVMTPGTFVQQAILPPWIFKAIALFLLAVVALWILWKTLLQPSVESTAREAVAEPIEELENRVDDVEETVDATAELPPPVDEAEPGADAGAGGEEEPSGAEDAGGATDEPAGTDAGGAGPAGEPTPTDFATPFGDPVDFQLGVPVGAGANQSFDEPITGEFALTDMIVQNPRGDTGSITILRGGERIFVSALENFRDLDRHFVAPYVFAPGETLTMTVTCDTPGAGASCDVSASFAGFMK